MGFNAGERKVGGSERAGVHVSQLNRGNGGSVTDYSSSVRGRREVRPAAHSSPALSCPQPQDSLSHVMKVHVSSSLLLNCIQCLHNPNTHRISCRHSRRHSITASLLMERIYGHTGRVKLWKVLI